MATIGKKTDLTRGEKIFRAVRTTVTVSLLVALAALCWFNRDKISVRAIVNYAPGNTAAAIIVMLALFALKSFFLTLYGGILYTASGILFPLPLAVLVNTIGTVLMTGVPFLVGKRIGTRLLDRLAARYEKLRRFQAYKSGNEVMASFVVRMVGLLPGDLVGLYFGARDFRFTRYMAGTMLGLFPSILAFSVMGMRANDIRSPVFWVAAGVQIGITVVSVSWCLIRRARKKREGAE